MQRGLVQAILDEISAKLPQFKTVDLFNNQLEKQDEGVIDSFAFPALFISFPEGADYENYSAGTQKGAEMTVRFYIADSLTKSRLSINKTVLEIFDLKQEVFKVFNGFQKEGFNTFVRVFEETDEDRTNYYTFIQDYKTSVLDSETYVNQGEEVTLTANLTTELVINPNTVNNIRTAKDANDG
ncbi:tail related protein [uncultured Mediterranean phage uvMED]|nr:tail related protein [uncultured Mediterranean phage uvMED]BAR22585.1 tail related protein [uncultured Mediterranean phage uvMED]